MLKKLGSVSLTMNSFLCRRKATSANQNTKTIQNTCEHNTLCRISSYWPDRVSGRIDIEAKPGKSTVIPREIENAMVAKALSRADQGFGLSKRTMIARAGTLCKSMGFRNNFTNGIPGKAWWAGLKARHPALTLRRPGKLSTRRSKARILLLWAITLRTCILK